MKLQFVPYLAVAVLATTHLCAGVVKITPSQLGAQSVSNLGLNSAGGICNVPGLGGACGGGFTATVAGTSGVTLWCVDSQEFDTNNAYMANIVSLSTPAGAFDNGAKVRYGSVGLDSTNWLYSFSGVTDALSRYQLAAILITMYNPQQAPTDKTGNPYATQNDNVQQAIWELTENNSILPGQSGTNGEPTLATPPTPSATAISLVMTAQSMLAGFNFNGWAVVSGGYANGTLAGQPNIQTYLVEVTPEPRFYGLILVGLLSLCGVIYRRRMAS